MNICQKERFFFTHAITILFLFIYSVCDARDSRASAQLLHCFGIQAKLLIVVGVQFHSFIVCGLQVNLHRKL